jgi:hypothetical protein
MRYLMSGGKNVVSDGLETMRKEVAEASFKVLFRFCQEELSRTIEIFRQDS